MEVGPRCLARFDYEGGQSDDLQFKEGDIIELVERIGDEWLLGKLCGKSGLFPLSFVQIIEDLPELDTKTSESTPILIRQLCRVLT